MNQTIHTWGFVKAKHNTIISQSKHARTLTKALKNHQPMLSFIGRSFKQ